MGYRVRGILKLPDGSPASNAEIEFISRKNFSPLVQELKSNIKCSATGAYDVTLEYGEYAVIVYPGGTYPAALGTIILAADTVAGQDLPTLLQQAGWRPATPEYIQQIAAWLAEANASAASAANSASAAKVSEASSKASEASAASNAATATTKAAMAAAGATAAASKASEATTAARTATTKATEAASSASSALTSKNAAATSATTASTAATTASTKAREAATSATSATNAASSAASSAASAANAITAHEAKAGAHGIAGVTGLQTALDAKLDKTEAFEDTPLPDVWIPFSDNLRMLAGYGDDIKVGDYTVATQASFSRASTATYIDKSGVLRTAAINEPRFEKEGLLIEGQSTNLFLYSKSPDSYPWSASGGNTSYIKIPDGVRITGTGYFSYQVLPVIAGQKYTFSVTCKVLSGTLNKVGLEGDAPIALGSGLAPDDGAVRLSGTATANADGYATCVFYPAQDSVVEFTDIQIEALPFASSYIPTNGAAATRAADRCWVLWDRNLPLSVREPMTAACEYKLQQWDAQDFRTIVDLGASSAALCTNGNGSVLHLTVANTTSTLPVSATEGVLVGRYEGATLSVSNGRVVSSSEYTPDADRPATRMLRFGQWSVKDTGWDAPQYGAYRCLWGHIRNFRIWHHALTDAQIKGLK